MKAIIFDRDGTLIEFIHFLCDPNLVKLNKDIIPVVNYLVKRKDILFYLHTNQSGICRGLFGLEDVEKCNSKMIDLFNKELEINLNFSGIYIAPGFDSKFRKPTDIVAKTVMKNNNLSVKDIVYIGDSLVDYKTSIISKCKCILYRGYASKPINDDFLVNKKYIANNSVELFKLIKNLL